MDPPANFNGLRRKRYDEDPFVTFSIPDRKLAFDRLFEADSLDEFKASLQSRAKLGPDVRYDLIHTRDGDEVTVEDDQDFKAFAASTRYYHHSRVRVQITSGPSNSTSTIPTEVGGSLTAASDDNTLEGRPPAKKRRIQAPKASIELSGDPAAPNPATAAPAPPAQEKPKPRRKPVSKAAQASTTEPPPAAPSGPGTSAGDAPAPAPAPAPKRPRKKADATTANDTEARPGVDGGPALAVDGGEVVKVGPPAKKPRQSTSKKATMAESTANPPQPASEAQPAASTRTSGGNSKRAAPKTPATLPSSSSESEEEDTAADTTNRIEPGKGPKKKPAPIKARARSASSASSTSSVHPEEEAVAQEAQPTKAEAAPKSKATAAKDVAEGSSKPKSRAKAAAKSTPAVEGETAADQPSPEVLPKKKRAVKPKSTAAGQDTATPNDAAPAKPKAARAPKSKAAPPPEDQASPEEEDHGDAPANTEQKPTKKRKQDIASAAKVVTIVGPAAKKPRKSIKPVTGSCRICLSTTSHNWFDCPMIMACIAPPQTDDDKKALDAALPQLSERLEQLVQEQAKEPKRETADLITSIKTSITMAEANQRGEPMEDASKKRRRTTSTKKKDAGDPAAAGEKEKGEGKKTEVLETFASTRVKENGPNAVPPSVSPTATATDLPANARAIAISSNEDSRPVETEEVETMEGRTGQGREGVAKKAKSSEKTRGAVTKLSEKEASERIKSPAGVVPLPSGHVANETAVNPSNPVNKTTLAPEPRWSATPEPTSRPNKDRSVPTVTDGDKSQHIAKQKNSRKEPAAADTPHPNIHQTPKRVDGASSTIPTKSSKLSSTPAKKLSYLDAFVPSDPESNDEDSDGDVEMKNTNPSSRTRAKSKARTFVSPSPPPDLTPSRLKTVSSLAGTRSVLRPPPDTESESEENSDKEPMRTSKKAGPPSVGSSREQLVAKSLDGSERTTPLRRVAPTAKGNVASEEVLVPGTPGQDESSSDESSEEEEEAKAAQPKAPDQEKKATAAPQPVAPPNPTFLRPPKPLGEDATPKPQDKRPASPANPPPKSKQAESSESESSGSSDSEDEKAVSEAVKPPRKESSSSDSSTSSKAVDTRHRPLAARPSASQSTIFSASRTPTQKSFPSLQSLSSQPRRSAYRPPNFLSQPRRPDSSQVQQQSKEDDSDDSDDSSDDDDDVPKERRAGAGLQKKKRRLDSWSQG